MLGMKFYENVIDGKIKSKNFIYLILFIIKQLCRK